MIPLPLPPFYICKLHVQLESNEPNTLPVNPILMGGLTLKIANHYN